MTVYLHHLDPYDILNIRTLNTPGGNRFTSTPMVYDFLKFCADNINQSLFFAVMVFLHVSSTVGICSIMARIFLGSQNFHVVLALGIYLTLFSASGEVALAAANNGTVLYALLVGSFTFGLMENRWIPFHLAVFIAILVKPFYIAFWLLPVFINGFSRRQFAQACVGVAVSTTVYLIYDFSQPVLFESWLHSVVQQTLVAGDLGTNIFGALKPYGEARQLNWLPYFGQLVYIALITTIVVFGRLRGPARSAALFVVAIFVNPRPLPYDLAVAAIPLVAVTASLFTSAKTNFGLLSISWLLLVLCEATTFQGIIAPSAVAFPMIVLVILGLASIASRRPGIQSQVSTD